MQIKYFYFLFIRIYYIVNLHVYVCICNLRNISYDVLLISITRNRKENYIDENDLIFLSSQQFSLI
jgi:hypothetical protein